MAPAILETLLGDNSFHDSLELNLANSFHSHISGDRWRSIPIVNTPTSRNVPAVEIKSEGLIHNGKDFYYNVSIALCNLHGASKYFRSDALGEPFNQASFLHKVLTWNINGASFSPSNISKMETKVIGDRVVNMEIKGRFSATEMAEKYDADIGISRYAEVNKHSNIFAIAQDNRQQFLMKWEDKPFLPIITDLRGDEKNFLYRLLLRRIDRCFYSSDGENEKHNPRISYCQLNDSHPDDLFKYPKCDTSLAFSLDEIYKEIKKVYEEYQKRELAAETEDTERILLIVDGATLLMDTNKKVTQKPTEDENAQKQEIKQMLTELISSNIGNKISTILIEPKKYTGYMMTMFMKGSEPRLFYGYLPDMPHSNFIPKSALPGGTTISNLPCDGIYWDPSEFSAHAITIPHDPSLRVLVGPKIGETESSKRIEWKDVFQDLYVLHDHKYDKTKWMDTFIKDTSSQYRFAEIIYCKYTEDEIKPDQFGDKVTLATSIKDISVTISKALKKAEEKTDKHTTVLVLDNALEMLSKLENTSEIEDYDEIKILADIASNLRQLADITSEGRSNVRMIVISGICDMNKLENIFSPHLHSRLFIGEINKCPEMFIPHQTETRPTKDIVGLSEAWLWEPIFSKPQKIYVPAA